MPCSIHMAAYHGRPTAAKTSAAMPMSRTRSVRNVRSRHQIGSSTSPGMTSATGPFIRKPRPAAAPASAQRRSSAVQIPSVMKNVSGRSGSAARAIAK